MMDKIEARNITPVAAETGAAEVERYARDQVGPGKQVVLHFELRLTDGTVIDSNFEGKAVSFKIGDGNLLPGFEQAIFGLRKGQEQTVEVAPEKAFGQVNPDNIQQFPRYRFPADLVLEKGLVINFADAEGNDQPGVIAEYSSERVSVDFNHPLAGRAIMFRVKILEVEKQD